MKRSRPINSSQTSSRPDAPRVPGARSLAQLREMQRLMAGALFRPLNAQWRMQKTIDSGGDMRAVAASFIKPNDRLTSFERLEIYSRSYWFRILDCLYEDYPGLRAVIGERRFMKRASAYLAKYPSNSFTLRNLGDRLETFLREEPQWTTPRQKMALDMARFEWAQVVAFDGESKPPITPDDILDATPARLRLALQPYITLLELNHAVDEFLIAVKKRDGDSLRSETSNTPDSAPQASTRRKKPIRPPRRERVLLAVHRHGNILYYKRLDPEAFTILTELFKGTPVASACEMAILQSPRENTDWVAQIKEWFTNWSKLGWFCHAEGFAPPLAWRSRKPPSGAHKASRKRH